MTEPTMVYLYHELSNKKALTIVGISNNLDGSQGHYAEQKGK